MLEIRVPKNLKISKQQQLNQLLFELADNNTRLNQQDIIKRLENIYAKDFRHQYSNIFPIIIDIDKSNKYSIDILCERLEEYLNNVADESIKSKLIKLKDHINLEASRLNYYKAVFEKNDYLLENFESNIQSLNAKYKKLLKEIEHSSDNLKNQVTTVLGIFATIVLSFAGGMTFTTSAFNSVSKIGIYNTIVLILLLGVIFLIAVYSLTYTIARINNINLKNCWFVITIIMMIVIFIIVYCCHYYT